MTESDLKMLKLLDDWQKANQECSDFLVRMETRVKEGLPVAGSVKRMAQAMLDESKDILKNLEGLHHASVAQ